jgi:uncharacterized protein YxjI
MNSIYGDGFTGAQVLANGCEIPTGEQPAVTETETIAATTTVPVTVTTPDTTVTMPGGTTTEVITATVTVPGDTATAPGTTTVVTVPSDVTTTVTLPSRTTILPGATTTSGGQTIERPPETVTLPGTTATLTGAATTTVVTVTGPNQVVRQGLVARKRVRFALTTPRGWSQSADASTACTPRPRSSASAWSWSSSGRGLARQAPRASAAAAAPSFAARADDRVGLHGGRERARLAASAGRPKGGEMGLLRKRGPDGTRYTMREKMFAIGDDFWIETEEGEKAFKVDGKALRIRDTFVLKSPSGEELFTIQEKKLSIRDKMEIERNGKTVATIKKALVSPLRDRYSISVEDGQDLEAKGNIVDHEFKIERGGDKIAEISKRWLRIRDTYGIEVAPDEDDGLIIACTVCIDQMGRVG